VDRRWCRRWWSRPRSCRCSCWSRRLMSRAWRWSSTTTGLPCSSRSWSCRCRPAPSRSRRHLRTRPPRARDTMATVGEISLVEDSGEALAGKAARAVRAHRHVRGQTEAALAYYERELERSGRAPTMLVSWSCSPYDPTALQMSGGPEHAHGVLEHEEHLRPLDHRRAAVLPHDGGHSSSSWRARPALPTRWSRATASSSLTRRISVAIAIRGDPTPSRSFPRRRTRSQAAARD